VALYFTQPTTKRGQQFESNIGVRLQDAAKLPHRQEQGCDILNRCDGCRALLIVEQNVRRILDAAHRVVVLDMGRNAFAGVSAELRQSDRIRRLYLGEDAG